MITTHSIDTIISDPAIRGGRPAIAGTTLTVADIAAVKIFHQQEPEGIASWFNIPLQDVHAALAYYYAHREAVDADIRQRDEHGQLYKEQKIGSRQNPILPR